MTSLYDFPLLKPCRPINIQEAGCDQEAGCEKPRGRLVAEFLACENLLSDVALTLEAQHVDFV